MDYAVGRILACALIGLVASCAAGETSTDRIRCSTGVEDGDDGNLIRVPGGAAIFAPNPSGIGRTVTPSGSIDTTNLFFRSVGINGRACASCHVASQGWTVTPEGVRDRFDLTSGLDPIFRTNDGSNSPSADVSSVAARRSAYSMLLRKALIRVGI